MLEQWQRCRVRAYDPPFSVGDFVLLVSGQPESLEHPVHKIVDIPQARVYSWEHRTWPGIQAMQVRTDKPCKNGEPATRKKSLGFVSAEQCRLLGDSASVYAGTQPLQTLLTQKTAVEISEAGLEGQLPQGMYGCY